MKDTGDNKDGGGKDGGGNDSGAGIVTRTRAKTKKPSLYKVLLLNDDYTPMEFVVLILEKFFSKDREAAVEVMLNSPKLKGTHDGNHHKATSIKRFHSA